MKSSQALNRFWYGIHQRTKSLLSQKSSVKTGSLGTQKSSVKTGLLVTQKSSANIIPCWLKNHWQELSCYRPRNCQRNQSYDWCMESSAYLFYYFPQESLTKLLRCRLRNHQHVPILRLMLGSPSCIIYCRFRNHWRKLSLPTQKSSTQTKSLLIQKSSTTNRVISGFAFFLDYA
jgi:hypothetical protein